MRLDLERLRDNVRRADTEDLLDRATVYRDGMEPAALDLIDHELRERGVRPDDLAAHHARRGEVLTGPDGLPRSCGRCRRPAVALAWEWGRLWGLIPLFPRRVALCAEHQPRR